MSLSQDRWVLAAIVVAESSWVFAALGVLAAIFNLNNSPMHWPSILVTLGAALLVSKLTPSYITAIAAISVGIVSTSWISGPTGWFILILAFCTAGAIAYFRPAGGLSIEVTYFLKTVVGLGVAYLMIGSNISGNNGGFDLDWTELAFAESVAPEHRFIAISGLFIGMALWWRGSSLAWKEFPIESLNFSFRLGIFCLAIAVTIDIMHSAQLNTFPMVFLFFASGLGGLSIGHLLPESRVSYKKRTWPRVITGIVTTVLGAGFLFSFLHRDILNVFSRPARSLLDTVVTGAFWGLLIPISTAWNVFVDGFLSVFEAAFGNLEDSPSNRRLRASVERRATEAQQADDEGGEIIALLIQIIEWIMLAIVALILLYLLYRFLRKLLTRGPKTANGFRQSVRPDSDLNADVTRLIMKLIPSWIHPKRNDKGFYLPAGPPGVIDALRIYYQMLNTAHEMGLGRRGNQTPREYANTLGKIYPKQLVSMATNAFIWACYGDHPANQEQLSEMTSSINETTRRTKEPDPKPYMNP